MTRGQNSRPNEVESTTSDRQKQWVFLATDHMLSFKPDADSAPQICSLCHPKTREKAMFLFDQANTTVYEITAFNDECRSWFIGEHVQEDGTLLLTTEMDPVYLILPYLIKHSQSGKSMPLDLILQDDEFPEAQRLCSCVQASDVGQVAEVKGDADLQAYKYSKDKTMSWLKSKVENVADALEKKGMHVSGGSHLSCYFQSRKNSTGSREDYVRYAYGMISDYLPLELATELKDYLGIKEPIVEKTDVEEPPLKRAKTEPLLPSEDYSNTNGKPLLKKGSTAKLTTAQKKLSQVDKKGMKDMFSFFKKK